MNNERYSMEYIQELTKKALIAHNTLESNADLVAGALVLAEAEGQRGHGLSRVPSYCAQAASGKVNGRACPELTQVSEAVLRVDAAHGFAFPALYLAIQKLASFTDKTGIGAAAIFDSHHCGVAGHHVEALARHGLLAMLFANTPQAIAPWGGKDAIFGTNPIAFAAPRGPEKEDPIVIDMSLSKVARGKIMFAKQEGKAIPDDWALDSSGQPTSDPDAALIGSMLPMGGAKGAALVFMVEILAAALTGANLSYEASSFFTADGPAPDVGQFIIALSPDLLSGGSYNKKTENLLSVISRQQNVRIPGDRRFDLRKEAQKNGLQVTNEQYNQLIKLSEQI